MFYVTLLSYDIEIYLRQFLETGIHSLLWLPLSSLVGYGGVDTSGNMNPSSPHYHGVDEEDEEDEEDW